MSETHPYTLSTSVTFPTPFLAKVCLRAINVDPELSDRVVRTIATEGNVMTATFAAQEARFLRVSVGGFYDMVTVVVKGMGEFGGDDLTKV